MKKLRRTLTGWLDRNSPRPIHARVGRPQSRYARLIRVVALISFLIVSSAQAQVRYEVTSETTCPRCEITLRPVARLGTSEGDGAFASPPYSIARDSRGRFYVVTPESTNEPPYVFDEAGRFLRRLGRPGDGPGEYRAPSVVLVTAGDTIRVFDQVLGHLTVLSPSYELIRTVPIPNYVLSAADIGEWGFVVNARVADATVAGLPLHGFDADGNYLRSYGDDTPTVRPRYPLLAWRRIAPARTGGVWSAPYVTQYVIERWTPEGTKEAELVRRAEWFEPYDRFWLPTPSKPPAPRIMGLWEDDTGLVWVVAHAAGRNWGAGLGDARRLEGQLAYPVEDWQAVYDGVIEVIDPATGRLVSSRRFAGTFDIAFPPHYVGGVREAADGWHYVIVWQAALVRP